MTAPHRIVGLYVAVGLAMTLAAIARAAVGEGAAAALLAGVFWAMVQGAGLRLAYTGDGAPPKKLMDGIAAVGMAAFLFELLSTGWVQALMTLLLWLQAARNPALTKPRDAYFALAISLTLMTFAAAGARDTLFVAALVVYGLVALAVLIFCHQLSGLQGERVSALKLAARTGSFPLTQLATTAVSVFAIALCWYLLVPRPNPIHAGIVPTVGGAKYSRADWIAEARNAMGERGASKSEAAPGLRESLPDRDSSSHAEPPQADQSLDITRSKPDQNALPANSIVMYVQADRTLYLRGRTFDDFENDHWSSSSVYTHKLLPERGRFTLSNRDDGIPAKYVVEVVASSQNVLPLSAQVRTLAAPADVIAVGDDGAVYLSARIEPGFKYAATSLLPKDEDRPVVYDSLRDRDRYLQLPDGVSPRIRALAQSVTAGSAAPMEQALALESHLRSHYAYSFETVFTSQNTTPLESFLFDTQRGHCEFFASAMAVMLRAVGVPSRVVHGYLAHSFNPATGFYEVRAFDGHAWVEAYIDGRGWTTFEPTAAYPIPQRQQQSGTALIDLQAYTEKLAQQEVLQGKVGISAMIARALRELTEGWHALAFRVQLLVDSLRELLLAHALVLAALVAVMAGVTTLVYRQRFALVSLWAHVAMRATPAERAPVVALRWLERLARTRRLGRAPAETIDEYATRLGATYAAHRTELQLLRRAFNAARYGERTLSSMQTDSVLRAFEVMRSALSVPQAGDPHVRNQGTGCDP